MSPVSCATFTDNANAGTEVTGYYLVPNVSPRTIRATVFGEQLNRRDISVKFMPAACNFRIAVLSSGVRWRRWGGPPRRSCRQWNWQRPFAVCGLVQPCTEQFMVLYRRSGVSNGLPRRRRLSWAVHSPLASLGRSQPGTVQAEGMVLQKPKTQRRK